MKILDWTSSDNDTMCARTEETISFIILNRNVTLSWKQTSVYWRDILDSQDQMISYYLFILLESIHKKASKVNFIRKVHLKQ